MRKELSKQVYVKTGGVKASLTSDGWTAGVISFSGYENVMACVVSSTPSTSVAVLTMSFQKNIVTDIASDAASSDWAAIASDCSIVAQAYAASTTTYTGVVDIKIPSSDSTGLIRASVLTPGEGLTIDGLAIVYVLYGGTLIVPNTDYSPAIWP